MKKPSLMKRIPLWVRLLICLLLAALLLLGIGYAADRANRGREVPVSTYSAEDGGLKGLYLSAGAYLSARDVEVLRFAKGARFLPRGQGTLTVVAGLGTPLFTDSFETNDLRQYLEDGGALLSVCGPAIAAAAAGVLLDADTAPEGTAGSFLGLSFVRYRAGAGTLLFVLSEGYTNAELKADAGTGAELLVFLGRLCLEEGYTSVLFDDYYAGVDESSAADVLGLGMVLALIELGLCLAALLVAVGGRFGAPEAVPSLEKRSELEPIGALAGMYDRAGGSVNVFKVHMEALCDDLKHHLGLPDRTSPEELLAEAEAAPSLRQTGAAALLEEYIRTMGGRTAGPGRNKLKEYIREIDGIREGLQ